MPVRSCAGRASVAEKNRFPALTELGLGDEEREALRRQGYLQLDQRSQNQAGYWRLRFRVRGRIKTVYLGRDGHDQDLLCRVRSELDLLSAPRRAQKQLTQEMHQTKQNVLQAKRRVKPTLTELGFSFHGDTIRRTRIMNPP